MPRNRALNQIDRVIISKRRSSSIIDVKSMRGANCDSDHYLVRSILRQKIMAKINKANNIAPKWNVEALNSELVKDNYQD